MLLFIAGLMTGGMMGVVMMCLLVAGREADAHMLACEKAKNDTPQMESRANDSENEDEAL